MTGVIWIRVIAKFQKIIVKMFLSITTFFVMSGCVVVVVVVVFPKLSFNFCFVCLGILFFLICREPSEFQQSLSLASALTSTMWFISRMLIKYMVSTAAKTWFNS